MRRISILAEEEAAAEIEVEAIMPSKSGNLIWGNVSLA